MKTFVIWMFALACALFLIFGVGCTIQRTSFSEDAAGMATFNQLVVVPPLGKVDSSTGSMTYRLNADQTWEIIVGQDQQGADNTDQKDAFVSLINMVADRRVMKNENDALRKTIKRLEKDSETQY